MQPGGRDQACWKRKIRAFPWGQATGIHHLKFAHLVVTSSSASRCSARSCPHRSSSPPPTPTSTPRSSARSRPRRCSSSTIFCLIRAAIFDGLQKAQAAQGVGARGGARAAETSLTYAVQLAWSSGFTKPTSPVKPPTSGSGLPDRFDRKLVEIG